MHCSSVKLQSFCGDLRALGYKNGADQVVDRKTGERFNFFVSDNDEVKLKHKEATYRAARREVLGQLVESDVKLSLELEVSIRILLVLSSKGLRQGRINGEGFGERRVKKRTDDRRAPRCD